MKESILLPGRNSQLILLQNSLAVEGFNVLIIGPGTASIADQLKEKNNNVQIITGDYDSMIDTRLELSDKTVSVKIMEYEHTDFNEKTFDLVYAQSSISGINRNKIIKEIKRILKPDAYLCVGEVVRLNPEVPRFVSDIWDRSELLPLYINDIEKYYADRNFEILAAEDLSKSLKQYYQIIHEKVKESKTGEETGSLRKELNMYSHESNTYLKLGGEKYMGFKTIILRKR